MLQHLAADYGIEGAVRKGKRIDLAVTYSKIDPMPAVNPGMSFGLIEDVHGMALVVQSTEKGVEHAMTSPDIQHLRVSLEPKGNFTKAIDAAPKQIVQLGGTDRIEIS